jgi:hypothetical protein
MAKQEKKLELVPATETSMANNLFSTETVELPKGAVKLTKPSMLELNTVPIGAQLRVEIVALADSISNRENMKDSKLIHAKHSSGTEMLIPLTGVIKKAIGGNEGVKKHIGDTLILVRKPNKTTTKYSGEGEPPKKMYDFDVYIVAAK